MIVVPISEPLHAEQPEFVWEADTILELVLDRESDSDEVWLFWRDGGVEADLRVEVSDEIGVREGESEVLSLPLPLPPAVELEQGEDELVVEGGR